MYGKRLKELARLTVAFVAIAMIGSFSWGAEDLFLTDSGARDNGSSELFRVHIDALTGHGNLESIFTIPFDQVDALACTPDGNRCYAFDNFPLGNGKLGWVDLNDNSWHGVGLVTDGTSADPIPGIVLAAFSPSGELFAASGITEKVYVVDPGTGVASELGHLEEDTNPGVTIDLDGADLAFTADGRLFLYSNPLTAMFSLTLPPVGGIIVAHREFTRPETFVTGLAVRANGFGELIGSQTRPVDEFITPSTTYPMYLNGSPYAYTFGDMSSGSMQLCGFTIGYYKNHDWNGAGVNICGVPIDETAGKEILWNATGRNFSMLFAQLIAAKLNINDAGGLSIIDDAEAWLCQQTNAYDGNQLIWDADFDSKAQKSVANQFKDPLDAFNNANHCDDESGPVVSPDGGSGPDATPGHGEGHQNGTARRVRRVSPQR